MGKTMVVLGENETCIIRMKTGLAIPLVCIAHISL